MREGRKFAFLATFTDKVLCEELGLGRAFAAEAFFFVLPVDLVFMRISVPSFPGYDRESWDGARHMDKTIMRLDLVVGPPLGSLTGLRSLALGAGLGNFSFFELIF